MCHCKTQHINCSLFINRIFYIWGQNNCKAIKKRMKHYHCPTCNKALQKLKFLSHLKNYFYIASKEKINDNEEILSSTPLESSGVTNEYLEQRKPERASKF